MSIRANLQHYIEKHPNEKLFLNDLVNELDLEPRQVQNGVYQLLSQERVEGLTAIQNGQIWLYSPNTKTNPDSEYYHKIGTTQKGSIILEDNEGILYIARKFEE